MKENPPSLEFDDIQGLALRGFGKMAHAAYVFFQITAKSKFQKWLGNATTANAITPASTRRPVGGNRQAIAFTAGGLQKLICQGWVADSFPPEFIEGMVQEHRSRLLGDMLANAPENWRWGYADAIDGVLVVAAEAEQSVEQQLAQVLAADNGIAETFRQAAYLPADGKEPFGFADGISQPVLMGTDRAEDKRTDNPRDYRLNAVSAGEFILGYPDGTGKRPRSPAISPAADLAGLLTPHAERPELRDFGRNGSFLVIRQLAQDVDGFHEFVKSNSRETLDIGAKMVGRTREGASLAEDSLARHQNDFDYLQDLTGRGCPLGSHVRRTNPRSTVHASSYDSALKVTNRHRIIRRGRIYKNADGETGLMFLCLNASINRQFEFIQSTWSNNPFFQGLCGEVDPIIGVSEAANGEFTMPAVPYRHKVKSLQAWVTVKGGGYFFLPGLTALKVLGSC